MNTTPRPQHATVAVLASLAMICAQLSPLFLAAPAAQAANGTWLNTGTSANWTNTTNWVGGTVPGATSAITGSNANTDTALFNTAVGTFGTSGSAIFIDSASENIRGITFDTAAGSYFIGGTAGNSLFLSSGGTTQILSTLTGTNVIETINAPLVIESANGTYTLQNNSANGTGAGSGTLNIGGQVSGGAAGATVLTLSGINTNANTISGNIINGTATTLAITKTGLGTWMLTGSNSYTGTTTINAGMLNLGGGGATGSISSSSPLSMGGGTLTFTRTGTNTQTFAGTTFTGGYSNINTTVATNTLALGALSRTAGSGASVNFGTTGTTTTTSTNTNGILGGWAMVGNGGGAGATADWAAVSGSGTIITYGSYTAVTGVTAAVATQNWNNTAQAATTQVTTTGTINSLKQGADFSVGSGATLTLNSGGLIMSGIARWFLNNGAGSTAGTGKITSGLASGELFLDVADATATDWRLWIGIVNSGTNPVMLVKNGPGLVTLRGSSSYTGGTVINSGVLALGGSAATISTELGTGNVTVNSGGQLRIGSQISVASIAPTIANNMTLAGGSIFVEDAFQHLSGTLNVTAATTLGSTFNSGANSTTEGSKGLFLDGVVTGSANLTLQHSGINTGNTYNTSIVYFVNNANTYSGTVTVVPMAATSGGSFLGLNGSNALQFANVVLTGNNTGNGNFGTSPLVFNTGLGTANIGSLSGAANVVLTGYNEQTHVYVANVIALNVGGNNSSTTYSGIMSGSGSLTKSGSGTMTLSGANIYTGATSVNAGTLTLSGSLGAIGTAAGQVNVGQAGNSSNAILNVQTGSILKLNTTNMLVGNGITTPVGQGFVYQTGGAVSGIAQLTLGAGASGSSYGYYNLSGGTLGLNELDAGGFNGATAGVVDVSGGTMNVANWLIVGRGGNGSSGVLNMTGGTLNYSGGNQFSVNWGQGTTGNQSSVVNIANASLISANATVVDLMRSGVSTNLGEINLLSGGLLQTNGIAPGSATGTSVLNFNGGTLKAFSANATFLTTNLTAVNVYSGGGTIDNNGIAITIPSALVAPAGSGANSNPTVTSGGSGYVGAPLVTVTGATGTGAAAYATVSGGVVTGIVVTSPGTGYTGSLSFTLTGGGGTGATIGTVTQTANTSGGMTFTGTGTTTVSSANTYTGATAVGAGTLQLNGAGSINSSSGIALTGGAKLLQTNTATAVTPTVTLTNGSLAGTGTVNNVNVASLAANTIINGNGGMEVLTIGTLTFSGSATMNLFISGTTPVIATTNLITGTSNATAGIISINVTGTNSIWSSGEYDLISYTGTIGGNGFASFVKGAVLPVVGVRQNAILTNTNNFVALIISGDTPIWTGSQSSAWTTNVVGGASNWNLIAAATPTDFITGDTMLFNDTAASTTLTINDADVTTAVMTFANNTQNYVISGSYGITGTAGTLVKGGTGSVTISTNNSYNGGTTVNAGTLTLSGSNTGTGATTLNAGQLNINNNSALGTGALVIAGGTIDNTSGTPVSLTTANSQTWSSNFTFGGSNDLNLGTGAVPLTVDRTVTTNGTANLTVGGVISGVGFGITKAGPGTMTLGGSNTYTGATTVSAGILNVTGAINSGSTANVGQVTAGNVTGVPATLKITGGILNATKTANPSLSVGQGVGGLGSVQISSGSITTTNELWLGGLADANAGYAAMTVTGGSVTAGSYFVVGFNNDNAVLNQSGGAITVSANVMTIGAGGTGANGVANLSGGTFTSNGGIFIGENGTGTLNISGSANVTLGGVGLSVRRLAGDKGILNLLGGTVSTNLIGNTAPNATGASTFNFNGGTIKATASSATFFQGFNNAYIYGSGGTIDTNTFNVTVAQNLLAPTGSGVTATGLTLGGTNSGYIDTPVVVITGGGGTGATAVANINYTTGVVTGITITNPGTDYTSDPTFTLIGGGGAATVSGTGLLAANTSGVLTKANTTGTLTLSGNNTYGGGTTLAGGVIAANTSTALGTGTATINAVTGNQLRLANGINVANSLTIHGGGATAQGVVYVPAGSATYSGPISIDGAATAGAHFASGTGTLTLSGAITSSVPVSVRIGTVIFSNTNSSYTALNINEGTGRIGATNAIPTGATVGLGLSAAANFDLAGFDQTLAGITKSTNGATVGNSSTTTDSTLTTTGTSTYAGVIQNVLGAGTRKVALSVNGGALTLTGYSSFTGDVNVTGGMLIANAVNNALNPTTSALGNPQASRNINVNSGGTLQFANGDTLGGANTTVVSTLVINDGGIVTNAIGNFTQLGPVTMNGGTLTTNGGAIAGYQSYSFSGDVTVGGTSASTMSVTGTGNDFNGFHLNTNTGFNVADATAGSDLIVSAPLIDRNATLTGAGGFTKSGAGTMSLTASNSYTGTTTVSAGTLSVAVGGSINGSTSLTVSNSAVLSVDGLVASPVTLNDTSTLKGKGTISGLVTTSAGTTVSPGNSTDILTLSNAGGFNLVGGAHLAMEIGGTTAGGGGTTGYDRLVVNGTLTLAGDLQGSLLGGFAPTLPTIPWDTTGSHFYIITGATSVVGGFSNVAVNPAYAGTAWETLPTITFGGQEFGVSYTANQGADTFTGGNDVALYAIPEPQTWAMLLGGFGMLLSFQRMRRKTFR